MPSRSQASSRAGVGGLCAVRIELKPASLRISTRRSSERSRATAPIGPWSWWTLPPMILTGSPLSRKPCWPFHASERMPKLVVTVSTTWPSTSTSARTVYRLGESMDHSAARLTGICTPLSQTSAFWYTPSNRSSICDSSSPADASIAKCLWYQPIPPTVYPIEPPFPLRPGSNGPITCGGVGPRRVGLLGHQEGREARRAAVGGGGVREVLDAPVVRKVEGAPGTVVVRGFLGVLGVAA